VGARKELFMNIQKAIEVSKIFLDNPGSMPVWKRWMKVLFPAGRPCGLTTVHCYACPMHYHRGRLKWWICAQPFYKLWNGRLDESRVVLALIEFIGVLETEKEIIKKL